MWIAVDGKAPIETLTDPAKIKRALSRYPRRYGMGPAQGYIRENYRQEGLGGYTGIVEAEYVGREPNLLYVHTDPKKEEVHFQISSDDPGVYFSRIIDAFIRNFRITDTYYGCADNHLAEPEKKVA